MYKNSFHNTISETGTTLANSEAKAQSQEEIILQHFKKIGRMQTAEQIHSSIFANTKTPLTSVRRALTNLSVAGELEKTNQQAEGSYGKKIFYYKLTSKNQINYERKKT